MATGSSSPQCESNRSNPYLEAKYEPLKTARHVVKRVGPQGGFQSLEYEYINEHGTSVHATTSAKAEAEQLEAFQHC